MEDLDAVLVIFILLFSLLLGYFLINEDMKKRETFKLCKRR